MPFDVTILQKKIEGLKEAYDNGNFGDALAGAVNTGNGLMQQRIFSQNSDVAGNNFGSYVGKKRTVKLVKSANRTQDKRNKAVAGLELTAYQEKRARKGRQTNPKDLEFEGSLRRSIETQIGSQSFPYVPTSPVTGSNEKTAILAFSNDIAAKIARGQENQITNIRNGQKGYSKGSGVRIFRLNSSEKEQVIEQGAELIKIILNKKK